MATINLFGNQPSVEITLISGSGGGGGGGGGGGTAIGLLDNLIFDFYVSTGGSSSNNGSIGSPWSLTYAAGGAGGVIHSGHKIAVRGGIYDLGNNTVDFTVNGAVGTGVDNIDSKVIFSAYPGEWPIIRNTSAGALDVLKVDCNYVWFDRLEVYDNGWTTRNTATQTNGTTDTGNNFGNGVKFVNCILHDGEQNIENSTGAYNTDKFEVYGNLIYNAGVDQSPLGHNFYSHHSGNVGGTAIFLVERNVIFNTFGLLGQFYANSEFVNYFTIINNIWFNGGALSAAQPYSSQMVLVGGGGNPPRHIKYNNNMLFASGSNVMTLEVGFSTGNILDFEVGNNYHVGGGHGTGSMNINRPVVPQNQMNVHDNFWYAADANKIFDINDAGALSYQWANNEWRHISTSGFDGTSFSAWKTATGLGGTDTQSDTPPNTTKIFVIPANKYHGNWGYVCYFNWGNLTTINADVSTILSGNTNYFAFDVRDLINPVLSGTYNGGTVALPTTQKNDPTPIGGFTATPAPTAPGFNAFLIRKM